MTCLVCGDYLSWSRMDRIVEHVHLVYEAACFNRTPPIGVAIRADVSGETPTFLCLACAVRVGGVAKKALKALGVSA